MRILEQKTDSSEKPKPIIRNKDIEDRKLEDDNEELQDTFTVHEYSSYSLLLETEAYCYFTLY